MSNSSKSWDKIVNTIKYILSSFHRNVLLLNNSKVFAALIVLTLNISSRFVPLKLSKTMESYLQFTFSRDLLVFCIIWMGCREIYVAFFCTIMFIIFMDYLLNEESFYCILPETFTTYHNDKALLHNVPSQKEIQNAKNILARVKRKL